MTSELGPFRSTENASKLKPGIEGATIAVSWADDGVAIASAGVDQRNIALAPDGNGIYLVDGLANTVVAITSNGGEPDRQ